MSGDDIKSQMFDTEDILSPLDLAPPTKKLMVMQEVGATERMFGFPGLNVAFVHIKKNLRNSGAVFATLYFLCDL